ncbi:MAG: lamin tail domain-containing protein [Planctomycetes bacterium]|nr:lamin tail domain-containing protein [Planctomycetota bacterium]
MPAAAEETVYLAEGSTWKFLPGLDEASSPDDAAWRVLAFDDGAWIEGPAPFGYQDGPFGTDLSLLDPPMRNNYTTFYLRQVIQVQDPARMSEFYARADFDDGFAMWVNGVEVLRVNAREDPGEPVPHDTTSSISHESGTAEEFELPDPWTYLVAGANIVAVQVLNATLSSTDCKFEVSLFDPVGPDTVPPVVASATPAPNATARTLTQVEVRFDEAVRGVDAADLRVNGSPAASVTGADAGPYVFVIDGPLSPGWISIDWAPGHGITDIADPPNAFAGGGWTVLLDPDAPLGDVVINEILASNTTGLTDEDGEPADWIELFNRGTEAVDLTGWSLTDDRDEAAMWILPAIILAPKAYRVILATGKDRPSVTPPHTNFKLDAEGEYLGLYNADSPRQVVSELSPRFPPQRTDVSYGIDGMGAAAYFDQPTPWGTNGAALAFLGFVADPEASVPHGFYEDPFTVEIWTRTPDATIYYSVDGSVPTPQTGTLYTGAIPVEGTAARGVVTLRAAAYKDEYLPSRAVSFTYIFAEHVLRQPSLPAGFPAVWWPSAPIKSDYEMDPRVVDDPGHAPLVRAGMTSVPALSIVMELDDLFGATRGIYTHPPNEGINWERPASAEWIFPDGREGFQANCGIRIQGGSSTTSSSKWSKLSLRLLFKSDYGPRKLRFPLFADSDVREFDTIVLDAHLNLTWIHPDHGQRVRSQYVRDAYVSDLQNAVGSLAPHDTFVHLYLNGLYWGLYDVHERPDDSFAASYLGGEPEEYDAFKHNTSTLIAGERTAWDAMFSLARGGLATRDAYAGIRQYLDVVDLADYMLVNFYAGNTDWAHQNWYAARRRVPGAGYRFFSWDAEHVLKGVSDNVTGVSNSGSPAELFTLLRANPEYKLLVADRAQRQYGVGGPMHVDDAKPAWDPDYPENNIPASLYMMRIIEIDPAIACESARWGDARRPTLPYTRNNEWMTELNWLVNSYFPQRSKNVLAQLRSLGLYPNVAAPVFSRQGGIIPPGFVLTMGLPSGATGTIYFTIDGSDPRVAWTSDISPAAMEYDGPVVLEGYTHIKARTLSGTTWSAASEAIFDLADARGALRITEIMYNPIGGSDYEFIEFRNTGTATIGLHGIHAVAGLTFAFPTEAALGPGEFAVIVSNAGIFETRYPGVPIAGIFDGRLANEGDEIVFADVAGIPIAAVDYDDEDAWPIGPDGFGWSLVCDDPLADPNDPRSWRASAAPGGSPGAEDPSPPPDGAVIGEVLARSVAPFEDAIEIWNPTAHPIDVGNWYLSDARRTAQDLRKYRIPAGTIIPAGGFAVFYAYQFNASPGSPSCFDLDGRGGAVYLTAADAAGAFTGPIVEFDYDGVERNVSIGWRADPEGIDFAPLAGTTFGADGATTVEVFRTGLGAPNAPAAANAVVINEIHYHPAANDEEFIELHNAGAAAVALYDPALGRGWRLSGVRRADETDDYEFGPGAEIPAGGFLVLSGIDPDVFRRLHAVPAQTPVAEPFGGGLDNAGEALLLSRPEPYEGGGVIFVRVDRVRYDDDAPWPEEADGAGPTLERIDPWAYGSDAANWSASTQGRGTPGQPNSVSSAGNRAPTARFAAAPLQGAAPLDVAVDASDSSDPDGTIVRYDWDFGDGSIASGKTTSHTFESPGTYWIVLRVTDDRGAKADASVLIAVEEAPSGGQLPNDINQDAQLDIGDAIGLLTHLFQGEPVLPCGDGRLDHPANTKLLDGNGDGQVDLGDGVYLLSYLFAQGPAPALGESCVRIEGCPDACAP